MKRQQYKEEMIRQVQMLAKELGRAPMLKEFHDDRRVASINTVRKYFSYWNDFLKEAGLEVAYRRNYSGDEMIRQVQMLAKELGRIPTCMEFNNDPRLACYGTVRRYFGGWNDFLEYAKLKPNKANKASDRS